MRVFHGGNHRVAALLLLLCLSAPGLAASRPKVHVVATGGTISSTGPGQRRLTGDELIRSLPGIDVIAELSVEQFSNIGSEYMTPDRWKDLALRLNEVFRQRPELDGIVVTHGTDTLEEGAFFLDLTVQGSKPVVLTGAMRSAGMISSDGPGNLFAAISVAASKTARGRGALVVMNDSILAGREVAKRDNLRVDAFQSPNAGPLGFYDRGEIHFHRPARRSQSTSPVIALSAGTTLPDVGIVQSFAGADERPIQSLVSGGAQGIVVAAFAGWSVSRAQEQAIVEAARKGVVVAMSSRTGGGRVLLDDRVKWKTVLDESLPVIGAGDLNPQKARILLLLGLTQTKDPSKLEKLFAAE